MMFERLAGAASLYVLFRPEMERLLGVGDTLVPPLPNLLDIVRVVRTETEEEALFPLLLLLLLLLLSVFAAFAALGGTFPEVEFIEIAAGLEERLSLVFTDLASLVDDT